MTEGPAVLDEPRRTGGRRLPERRLLVAGAILAVLYAASFVGIALTPLLVSEYPILMLLLQPTTGHILLVSARVGLVPLVVVVVLRRFAGHAVFFLLGQWYGERALRWVKGRGGSWSGPVETLEEFFARAGFVAVLLAPGTLVGLLAGASGMRRWQFAVLDLAGLLAQVLLVRFAAGVAADPLAVLVRFIDRNAGPLTVVFAVAALLWLLVRRRRGRTVVDVVEELQRRRRVRTSARRPPRPARGRWNNGFRLILQPSG